MESKYIIIDSDIGTGKTLCASARGRSIVRKMQCEVGGFLSNHHLKWWLVTSEILADTDGIVVALEKKNVKSVADNLRKVLIEQ